MRALSHCVLLADATVGSKPPVGAVSDVRHGVETRGGGTDR
jgi:hypothetical protein